MHDIPPSSRPRILLVGAGRFGRQHLDEWKSLHDTGDAELSGIVVRSEESARALREIEGFPVFIGFDPRLLGEVDGVDIVTPPDTHPELVERCLPHVHVLVEKPLATTVAGARHLEHIGARAGKVLMVGHVFRHHPTIRRLKEIVSSIPERPRTITGAMINPMSDSVGRSDANLEFLHLFDVIDHLFAGEPEVFRTVRRGGINHISLRYPGPMNAILRAGWRGDKKVRTLTLKYDDRDVIVDLVDNSIVSRFRANQVEKEFFPHRAHALRDQLRAFLAATRNGVAAASDAETGRRIVDIAIRARPHMPPEKPRVGIIGGGIFGAVIAIELGKFCEVTVYERHAELMTEVTFANQWRHHSGFHYPRSYDQIQEIKAARGSFEAEYGEAIRRSYPAYFCTSASGIEIPAERYLAACSSNYLSFSVEDPPPDVLDRSKVSICLRSDEGVYDYHKLKAMALARLAANPDIRVEAGTEAVDGEIDANGRKRITVRNGDRTRTETFDYLINATYANKNLVAKWFGFPIDPLRFDIYELLVLRLPIRQVCVTIMDGPFTSLVGMGTDNLFMLSHIYDSVLNSVITDDGLPPATVPLQSNRENMLRHSSFYLPILRKAEVIGSRFALRTVGAYQKDFDARPTVVDEHGFGVWSVLGGKILTSVSNAREIAAAILAERGTKLG